MCLVSIEVFDFENCIQKTFYTTHSNDPIILTSLNWQIYFCVGMNTKMCMFGELNVFQVTIKLAYVLVNGTFEMNT